MPKFGFVAARRIVYGPVQGAICDIEIWRRLPVLHNMLSRSRYLSEEEKMREQGGGEVWVFRVDVVRVRSTLDLRLGTSFIFPTKKKHM